MNESDEKVGSLMRLATLDELPEPEFVDETEAQAMMVDLADDVLGWMNDNEYERATYHDISASFNLSLEDVHSVARNLARRKLVFMMRRGRASTAGRLRSSDWIKVRK